MGKEDGRDASADPDRRDRRKRMRESGSQTEDEEHLVELGGSGYDASARFDEINAKLDKVLTACGEIEVVKEQLCGLKGTVKSLKTSLEFAEKEIEYLKGEMKKTTKAVDDNTDEIDSLDDELETYKRRNIKLEAYTRRENMKIFNVQEVLEDDTEDLVRNIFISKMQISTKDVNATRFERVDRISTNSSSQRPSETDNCKI